MMNSYFGLKFIYNFRCTHRWDAHKHWDCSFTRRSDEGKNRCDCKQQQPRIGPHTKYVINQRKIYCFCL